MTPDQIRAAMGDISTKLESIVAGANGYTPEQLVEIKALNSEFEALEAQLEAAVQVEAMKAKTTASRGRQTQSPNPAPITVQVGRDGKDRFGGFNSTGEFLQAVRRASGGDIDKRFQNTAYEKNGEDGGFLVPEEMSTEIQKKLATSESLLADTRQFTVSGNSLSLPIDESQPWNQGVTAYWTGEGQSMTPTKNVLGQAHFRLNKLTALVPATDELLDDAVAMESFIRNAAGDAIMHKVNEAIISGTGAGKPAGILGSGFLTTVDEEAMQDADTIVAMNVINMYAKMFPGSRGKAKWYVNAGAEGQLMGLKDGDGRFLYIAAGAMGNSLPYGTLLGRPVIPMMSALPALGDPGDLLFADLSFYYSVLKAGGVKSAASIHLYFDKEITAFRFSFRIDGKCPYKAPVTTQYGSHEMSAFVNLAVRNG